MTTSGRDRLLIFLSVAGICALAWGLMFGQAQSMENPSQGMNLCMLTMRAWHTSDFLMIFVMWAVMMVAMMLPSSVPMILTFAMVNRRRQDNEDPFVPVWLFVAGYLVIWMAFSILATLLQWYLNRKNLLSPMMISTSPILNSVLFFLAGIFQFTPLKKNCLKYCRSPFQFLMTEWREGKGGALIMGLRHGLFCLGCCWILMILLFVIGVMNLWGIVILSVFVLLEKILPKNFRFSRVSGFFFMGWSVLIVLKKFIPMY